MVSEDVPAVVAIVESLPEYFTGDAARQVGRDCASRDAWVLTDSDQLAGFTVIDRKSAGGAEILWMAVALGVLS